MSWDKFCFYPLCIFASALSFLAAVLYLVYGSVEIAIWLIILTHFLFDVSRDLKKGKGGSEVKMEKFTLISIMVCMWLFLFGLWLWKAGMFGG